MKKYILVFSFFLIASSVLMGCAKAEDSVTTDSVRTDAGGPTMLSLEGPSLELNRQSSLVRKAIQEMIATGLSPEKITFTGASSPNDVFGSGKINLKNLIPPPDACYPAPCSGWKFLPIIKKDKGWYVYGAATPAADIIAYLPGLSPTICGLMQMYPDKQNYDYTPPKQMNAAFDPIKAGNYSANGGVTTIKTEDRGLDGREEGCFDNHVGDGHHNYTYYRVLLAQ